MKQGWVLFTVIGLVLVVVTAFVTRKIDHFATMPTTDRSSQDMSIKQRTLMLAAQIREFIRDWKDSDDEAVQRQNVDKYITRFGHTALAVRDSLDQHGVRSPELDKLMFEFSYNYKDVRAIPVELERLANSAPVPMQFEVTEKDPQARADLAIAQSEIARLRATVKKFEDQASEQNTREWPPLTSEAEANWINVLAPYNIKLISVHWGQEVECKRFFRSLQSVGKGIGAKVQFWGGTADGEVIEIQTSAVVGPILRELFRKGNYPVETENDGDAPDEPANRQVSIFIPEKPIMPPP